MDWSGVKRETIGNRLKFLFYYYDFPISIYIYFIYFIYSILVSRFLYFKLKKIKKARVNIFKFQTSF